jgi:hypothetical protein
VISIGALRPGPLIVILHVCPFAKTSGGTAINGKVSKTSNILLSIEAPYGFINSMLSKTFTSCLLLTGDVAILRFSFAFFRVDERYCDVSPVAEVQT